MMVGSYLSPAQLVGYVALDLGVAAFLQKSDTRLKVLIAAESLAYVAHFILLGNFPASGSALVSCLRMLVSLKSRSPWWIGVFITVNIVIGVLFAKSIAGWLPITASCLATVAVFVLNGIVMRLILFVCTLLWLVNNLLSGSIGGTVLETIIAVVNLSTILRMTAQKGREQRTTEVDTATQTAPA
jgi:hypothetical protein